MLSRSVIVLAMLAAAAPDIAIAQGTAASQAAPGPQPIPRTTYLSVMDSEFKKMDADKDGIVTRQEIEQFQRAAGVAQAGARNRALFVYLDTDRNGQISQAEFARLIQPPAVNAMPLISEYDLNKDGKVSQVEYRTVKLQRFDRVDSDKDGIATIAEQRAAGLIK